MYDLIIKLSFINLFFAASFTRFFSYSSKKNSKQMSSKRYAHRAY